MPHYIRRTFGAGGARALFRGPDRRQVAPAVVRAAFDVLRDAGAEMPSSSPLLHVSGPRRSACAGRAEPLFDIATKFDNGTGWPSLSALLPQAVQQSADNSLTLSRTELHGANRGDHLGHLFDE